MHVALGPAGERAVRAEAGLELRRLLLSELGAAGCMGGTGELRSDAVDLFLHQRAGAVLQMRPLGFDLLGEPGRGHVLDQDLDAGLVLVVAPAIAVVDAQDRVQVRQQMAPGQKLADDVADDRRAAEAAADDDAKPDLTRVGAHRMQADVVHQRRRAIVDRAVDRDLELARQEAELRVQGRPLPHHLGPHERVDDLVGRDAGEVVGRDVAHAVAAGLDRVHLHAGQFGEDLRHLLQPRPVELNVLPRAEVTVAAVVDARDVGKLAHLHR